MALFPGNERTVALIEREKGRYICPLSSSRQDQITANDVARVLSLSIPESRDLLNDWVRTGWLEMTSVSRKSGAYQLSAEYRRQRN